MRVLPRGRRVEVTEAGATMTITILSWTDHEVRYLENGVQRTATCIADGDALHIVQERVSVVVREASPWPSDNEPDDPRFARAPVAGTSLRSASRPATSSKSGNNWPASRR